MTGRDDRPSRAFLWIIVPSIAVCLVLVAAGIALAVHS